MWIAPERATQHTRIIDAHGLWDKCIVPGIPVLAIVVTVGWERIVHMDDMAAPMFSIWFGGNQSGGNMCFPEFGFRHDDVRADNIRIAAWCTDVPHASTTKSGDGRVSISIFLSAKTLRAARCSKRRQQCASPSPSPSPATTIVYNLRLIGLLCLCCWFVFLLVAIIEP